MHHHGRRHVAQAAADLDGGAGEQFAIRGEEGAAPETGDQRRAVRQQQARLPELAA